MNYAIQIMVSPHGKGRHRTTRAGRTYTPEKTASAEAEIRYWLAKDNAPKFSGPVSLDIVAAFPKPKSAPKKRFFHTSKPDASNIVKTIEDAGNGVLWDDDKQIVSLRIAKVYADKPSVTVIVSDATPDDLEF